MTAGLFIVAASSMTAIAVMSFVMGFMMVLVFFCMNWVVMDWDGNNMRLKDDWVSKGVLEKLITSSRAYTSRETYGTLMGTWTGYGTLISLMTGTSIFL